MKNKELKILLAAPRGFCAGVDRAIEIVKKSIEKYGAPLKLTYLPKIGEQIERARAFFSRAFTDLNYNGKHRYCYVTKSCHFHFVLNEVLKYNVDLETSSEYDLDLITTAPTVVYEIVTNKAVIKEQIQNKMGGLSFVNITAAADKHKGNIARKTAL